MTLGMQDKLKAALKKAEDFNKADAETDLRKRKYNAAVGDDADVTPEEVWLTQLIPSSVPCSLNKPADPRFHRCVLESYSTVIQES